ncbi:cupin domain-containing protein [Anderseniella sp. Alg231-50]|uniref:cupin domain-containing protein n=1 Tax=Anderseniella sp. Alg231-50 TaxID=1922226 RepID=UPI000D561E94
MTSTSVTGERKTLHSNCVTPLGHARNALRRAVETDTAPLGLPAALLREHETLKLYFYEPRGQDRQPPHDQDEIYVVMRGSGLFAIGEIEEAMERVAFGPGDAIFAPAGAVHRFESFTDDFGTWVIMYGRQGGEDLAPAPAA